MSQFVKVTLFRNGHLEGSFVQRSREVDMTALFDGATVGEDEYRFALIEMTDEEYEELPEFAGF